MKLENTTAWRSFWKSWEVLSTVLRFPLKENTSVFFFKFSFLCIKSLDWPRSIISCLIVLLNLLKDPQLSVQVVMGLLKRWPITNSAKEVLFLVEMEELLELTHQPEFATVLNYLFRQLSKSMGSEHFQVAERALFYWHNEHICGLINDNRQEVLPIVYPVLQANADKHWNPTVKGLASNVLKIFQDVDADLVLQCQKNQAARSQTAATNAAKRCDIWSALESKVVLGEDETSFSSLINSDSVTGDIKMTDVKTFVSSTVPTTLATATQPSPPGGPPLLVESTVNVSLPTSSSSSFSLNSPPISQFLLESDSPSTTAPLIDSTESMSAVVDPVPPPQDSLVVPNPPIETV